MPRRRFALLLVLLVFALPAYGQGRIVFDAAEHTFADLREDDTAYHRFTFRNEGDAPLLLTSVRPSCGCTTPDWPRDPIAPDDTASIAVVYDAEGRPGPFERTIDVLTDGDPEFVTLYIRGNVTPSNLTAGTRQGGLLIDRELIFNETVPAGGAGTFTFRVQNRGEQPLHILDVEAPEAGVTVELPSQVIAVDELAEIRVHVDASELAAGDPFDHAIVLVTDDAAQPRKTLRLRGQAVDGVPR